jgi:hypothetical protein
MPKTKLQRRRLRRWRTKGPAMMLAIPRPIMGSAPLTLRADLGAAQINRAARPLADGGHDNFAVTERLLLGTGRTTGRNGRLAHRCKPLLRNLGRQSSEFQDR